ncbi:MAG: transposase, partial [Acidobacteria bacterium]|nr:transposase [Acidobacteriota bacterium]
MLKYRSSGPRDTTPPPITTDKTDIVIHPTYHEALDLQDVLVRTLGDLKGFHRPGLLLELPGAMTFDEYQKKLGELQDDLRNVPIGQSGAKEFEDVVGRVLKLCFYRPLTHVQEQVRNINGTIRRDWIASNRAQSGFWEVMRQRWDATQVLFECKNYENLEASDFH